MHTDHSDSVVNVYGVAEERNTHPKSRHIYNLFPRTAADNDFKYSFNRKAKLFHQKKKSSDTIFEITFSFVSMSYAAELCP